MYLTNDNKYLINKFINELNKVLMDHEYERVTEQLCWNMREEINIIHHLYKQKDKVFNLIFAYPKIEHKAIIIYVGAENHLPHSKEINNVIKDYVNAHYLLQSL